MFFRDIRLPKEIIFVNEISYPISTNQAFPFRYLKELNVNETLLVTTKRNSLPELIVLSGMGYAPGSVLSQHTN